MERLYDYCVSYTTGSIGTSLSTQPPLHSSLRASTPTASTGQEAYITLNNPKHQDFAISTIVYLLF